MNSKYKDVIIAVMAAGIFHRSIVEGISREKEIIGVIYIFLGTVAIMEVFDIVDMLRYDTKKLMTKYRFNRYKNSLDKVIEKQRAKGKDEVCLKNLVTNYVTRDKRFAFSGRQLSELLALSEEKNHEEGI